MHLMQQGVSGNNIIFINRELTAFDFIENYKDLDAFIHLYRQELKPEGRIYIFIDEVQDIDGWERVVNSLSQDYTEDYEILSQVPIPRCFQASCLHFCLVDMWSFVFSHCLMRNIQAFISWALAEKVICDIWLTEDILNWYIFSRQM